MDIFYLFLFTWTQKTQSVKTVFFMIPGAYNCVFIFIKYIYSVPYFVVILIIFTMTFFSFFTSYKKENDL